MSLRGLAWPVPTPSLGSSPFTCDDPIKWSSFYSLNMSKSMLTFGPLHFHSLVYSSLPWVFSGLALPFYSDFSSNLSSKENPFLTTQSNVSTTSNTHILNCFIFFIEIITLKLSYSWSVPHHLIDTQDDNFWSQFSLQRLYQGMDPQLICVNLQIILI